jgi:hypothetical protein
MQLAVPPLSLNDDWGVHSLFHNFTAVRAEISNFLSCVRESNHEKRHALTNEISSRQANDSHLHDELQETFVCVETCTRRRVRGTMGGTTDKQPAKQAK